MEPLSIPELCQEGLTKNVLRLMTVEQLCAVADKFKLEYDRTTRKEVLLEWVIECLESLGALVTTRDLNSNVIKAKELELERIARQKEAD